LGFLAENLGEMLFKDAYTGPDNELRDAEASEKESKRPRLRQL